jgi:hypothetical protein
MLNNLALCLISIIQGILIESRQLDVVEDTDKTKVVAMEEVMVEAETVQRMGFHNIGIQRMSSTLMINGVDYLMDKGKLSSISDEESGKMQTIHLNAV